MANKTLDEKWKSLTHMTSAEERRSAGKALRDTLPRKEQAIWQVPSRRRDVIDVLEESNEGRIPHLIPIRYGRMLKSPFTFYRGSAALMAADLASRPVTGLRVQACGDCHLLNFGAYATPERNIIVDINDFDETLPAPWEWDIKRLATSFVLACRANSFKETVCREVAETVMRSYRRAMQEFSEMRVLDVWYAKMDLEHFVSGIKDKELRTAAQERIRKTKQKTIADYYVPKMTVIRDGRHIFKDAPPLVYHTDNQLDEKFLEMAEETIDVYKKSLTDDRRVLLDRYEIHDVAMKIVGIGSVGTFCGVVLLLAGENDPLILQVKQARESVLEPYAGKSKYKNHAQRVVIGQRLMQAHSDIFLGWAEGTGKQHKHFYFRQLKDMKISLAPEIWDVTRAMQVALELGAVLARAHARSGDPMMISGYLGSKDVIDAAIADFAVAYANQTEQDHQTLVKAVRTGRVEAIMER